jgi:hypothetical protein
MPADRESRPQLSPAQPDKGAKDREVDTLTADGTAAEGSPGTAMEALTVAGSDMKAAGAQDTFTLDITFSGLCLLVRQTKGRDRLLVLLPPVPSEGGEMPEHLMVLGTHRRFAHTGPFERKGEFREYVLKDGALAFSNWSSAASATLELPEEVVDLEDAADGRPPIPSQARLRWAIGPGQVCTECSNDDGGVWRFQGRKQRMATRLTWRICGVAAAGYGRRGIAIKFTAAEGGEQNFFIQAVEEPAPRSSTRRKRWRAALYLYHTPADELPSHAGHPLQQAEEDVDENHHFAAYYGLFVPNLDVPLPVRVPDAEEDEDEDEDDDEGEEEGAEEDEGEGEEEEEDCAERVEGVEGNEKLLLQGPARTRFLRSATSAYHGFHGRLFTCTLAASTDRHTPQPSETATTPEG